MSHRMHVRLALAAVLCLAGPASAQDNADLAKKLTNPVSDLVSIPLQFNWEFNNGPGDDMYHVQNFQPVVPFPITDRTNMVARLIMPTITTPSGTVSGDMVFSLFFSPKSSDPVWGAGPVMVLPRIGQKWGIGPTAVVLKMKGPWTYGALANHIWSFAGDDGSPDINQTFLQPFLSHTWPNAVTFVVQSESVANWEASDDTWTVPLNFIVSKVAKLGPFPASYGGGPGIYLSSPDGGPEFKLRGFITLMLPTSK